MARPADDDPDALKKIAKITLQLAYETVNELQGTGVAPEGRDSVAPRAGARSGRWQRY